MMMPTLKTRLVHGVPCGAPKSQGSTMTCAFNPNTSTLIPPFIQRSKVNHAPVHLSMKGTVCFALQSRITRGRISLVKRCLLGKTRRGSLRSTNMRNQGLSTMDKGTEVSLLTMTAKSVSNCYCCLCVGPYFLTLTNMSSTRLSSVTFLAGGSCPASAPAAASAGRFMPRTTTSLCVCTTFNNASYVALALHPSPLRCCVKQVVPVVAFRGEFSASGIVPAHTHHKISVSAAHAQAHSERETRDGSTP